MPLPTIEFPYYPEMSLKRLTPDKVLSEIVDITNYNFEQIYLHGGKQGVQGEKGMRGYPGATSQGEQGEQGNRGSIIWYSNTTITNNDPVTDPLQTEHDTIIDNSGKYFEVVADGVGGFKYIFKLDLTSLFSNQYLISEKDYFSSFAGVIQEHNLFDWDLVSDKDENLILAQKFLISGVDYKSYYYKFLLGLDRNVDLRTQTLTLANLLTSGDDGGGTPVLATDPSANEFTQLTLKYRPHYKANPSINSYNFKFYQEYLGTNWIGEIFNSLSIIRQLDLTSTGGGYMNEISCDIARFTMSGYKWNTSPNSLDIIISTLTSIISSDKKVIIRSVADEMEISSDLQMLIKSNDGKVLIQSIVDEATLKAYNKAYLISENDEVILDSKTGTGNIKSNAEHIFLNGERILVRNCKLVPQGGIYGIGNHNLDLRDDGGVTTNIGEKTNYFIIDNTTSTLTNIVIDKMELDSVEKTKSGKKITLFTKQALILLTDGSGDFVKNSPYGIGSNDTFTRIEPFTTFELLSVANVDGSFTGQNNKWIVVNGGEVKQSKEIKFDRIIKKGWETSSFNFTGTVGGVGSKGLCTILGNGNLIYTDTVANNQLDVIKFASSYNWHDEIGTEITLSFISTQNYVTIRHNTSGLGVNEVPIYCPNNKNFRCKNGGKITLVREIGCWKVITVHDYYEEDWKGFVDIPGVYANLGANWNLFAYAKYKVNTLENSVLMRFSNGFENTLPNLTNSTNTPILKIFSTWFGYSFFDYTKSGLTALFSNLAPCSISHYINPNTMYVSGLLTDIGFNSSSFWLQIFFSDNISLLNGITGFTSPEVKFFLKD